MRSSVKAGVSLLTSAALLGQVTLPVALADEAHVTAQDQRTVVAHCHQEFNDLLITYTASYSDALFAHPAPTYSHPLGRATLGFAIASNSTMSSEADGRMVEVKQFLEGCGFADVQVNADWNVPGPDTIGVATAYRDTSIGGEPVRIFAVGVRCFGYGSEWASNFTLGASGPHQGFSESAAKVVAAVNNYVASHQPEDGARVALWITGYSRAGAVANLSAAAWLAEGKVGGQSLNANDVFAYTFEAPQVVPSDTANLGDARFASIHNLVNPDDWIGNCLGLIFGFRRYGQDHDLSGASYPSDLTSWSAKAYGADITAKWTAELAKINEKATWSSPSFAEQVVTAGNQLRPADHGRTQAEYGSVFGAWFVSALGLTSRADYLSSGAQESLRLLGTWIGKLGSKFGQMLNYVKIHAVGVLGPIILSGGGLSTQSADDVNEQLELVVDALPGSEDPHALRTEAVISPSVVSVASNLLANVSAEALAGGIDTLLTGALDSVNESYDKAEVQRLSLWLATVMKRLLAKGYDLNPLYTVIENMQPVVSAHVPEVSGALLNAFADSDDPQTVKEDGWHEVNGTWTYVDHGALKTGWLEDGGAWYYFEGDGSMKTGWAYVSGEWYYLNEAHNGRYGCMLTGWQWVGGAWYYLNTKHNGSYGAMLRNTTTPDGAYVGSDGRWVG